MDYKVDYTLYTSNILTDTASDIKAFLIPNKYLKFNENEIDLENKRFRRITDECEIIIDFETHMCFLKFDNLDAGKFSVEGFFKYTNNIIVLEYSLGEEIKRLEVTIKEI